MLTILSLTTSIKEYVEVVHKLVESGANNSIFNYYDLGAILTFIVLGVKQFFIDFFSLNWFQALWSLPIIIPDMASAIISEVSVLDGYFHNAFTFLETPISYGDQNLILYCIEKFTIGLINSLFLCLPTSVAHIITLRRFVMQGIEAGTIAGLGSIAGNMLWIGSIILGLRFMVIPWLSLDILRALLGFVLLVKYMWDSSTERRTVLEDLSKWKIFLLNFLLTFTEQTTLYPFMSHFSMGSDGTFLESFPTSTSFEFFGVHGCYLFGMLLGSLSLLQLTCWFWENPAFNIYMWIISSFKLTTTAYSKVLNFIFLYLTMICSISSIAYFGLDYTITNPLGFVHEDRLIDQKVLLETSFLNSKASDRNTRRHRGRHGRRERWKRRVRKYRTFDASLYDQGVYDLFTLEDLNYGFDRFWLRRKIRNHRVRFRFFPGPWMRSFKKQLSRSRLDSFNGPRVEFFRILFEQVYHPEFHEFSSSLPDHPWSFVESESKTGTQKSQPSKRIFNKNQELRYSSSSVSSDLPQIKIGVSLPILTEPVLTNKNQSQKNTDKQEAKFMKSTELKKRKQRKLGNLFTKNENLPNLQKLTDLNPENLFSIYSTKAKKNKTSKLVMENSALRKFVRNVNTRVKTAEITTEILLKKTFFDSSKNMSTSLPEKVKRFTSGTDGNPVQGTKIFSTKPLYSKRWKEVFSKLYHTEKKSRQQENLLNRFSQEILAFPVSEHQGLKKLSFSKTNTRNSNFDLDKFSTNSIKKTLSQQKLSKKDRQILQYRSFLTRVGENSPLAHGNKTKTNIDFQQNKFELSKTPSKISKNQNFAGKSSFYKPITLLHPVKFYLQKEQAFRRKLKFYGASLFRNFGVENNAPYFRTMMKRFFYYYKPTLRWERTMQTATMRKARRKNYRTPRKIKVSKEKKVLAFTIPSLGPLALTKEKGGKDQGAHSINPSISSSEVKDISSIDASLTFSPSFQQIQKPTHFYSLVGKRATRYRYQIFKDVLQHWYYSPFNRFLVKVDVDSFIRRQPKFHFLTKKEEQLLHIRRRLLSEHYDSLRWYTSMQHYASMKNHIGSTKSFASGMYHQQFQGTFKKIRHLFSVTPSSENSQILKFDQALYNEHPNYKNFSILKDSLIHEELLADEAIYKTNFSNNEIISDETKLTKPLLKKFSAGLAFGDKQGTLGLKPRADDLTNQSANVIREYMKTADPIRKKLMQKFLENKDYWSLTEFIFKGQKTRGTQPTTNEKILLEQEKKELFTEKEQKEWFPESEVPNSSKTWYLSSLFKSRKNEKNQEKIARILNHGKLQQNLWFTLLKKCQTQFYDQESLKIYLSHRIEKRERVKQNKQIQLKKRLTRLKTWLNPLNLDENQLLKNLSKISNEPSANARDTSTVDGYTTGLQKALKEGIYAHFPRKSIEYSIRKGKKPLLPLTYIFTEKSEKNSSLSSYPRLSGKKTKTQISSGNNQKSNTLKNHLSMRAQEHLKTVFLTEENLKLSLKASQKSIENNEKAKQTIFEKPWFSLKKVIKAAWSNFTIPFSFTSKKMTKTVISEKSGFLNPLLVFKKPFERKESLDLQTWRQKENVKSKRKKTRKAFKQLKSKPKKREIGLSSLSFLAFASSPRQSRNPVRGKSKTKGEGEGNLVRGNGRNTPKGVPALPKERMPRAKGLKREHQGRNKRDSSFVLRAKDDKLGNLDLKENKTLIESWKKWQNSVLEKSTSSFSTFLPSGLLEKNFKRKRSRLRRYRRLKGRGPIKKRSLGEKLKRQFKLLKRYSRDGSQDKKTEILKLIPKQKASLLSEKQKPLDLSRLYPLSERQQDVFQKNELKQRRTKQSKHRFWKKSKKPKYAQNKRKVRKRRRYALTKIRVLNKELKRMTGNIIIQKWWWQTFLPNLQSKANNLFEKEKNIKIREKLSNLTLNDLLKRDYLLAKDKIEQVEGENMLQIGQTDYKPLSIPQALRISQNLPLIFASSLSPSALTSFPRQSRPLAFAEGEGNPVRGRSKTKGSLFPPLWGEHLVQGKEGEGVNAKSQGEVKNQFTASFGQPKGRHPELFNKSKPNLNKEEEQKNVLNSLSNNLLKMSSSKIAANSERFLTGINPIPFYAGWDESLRKFVITNRLLSKVEASYQIKNKNLSGKEQNFSFTNAPLRGMNAATTLYWQVPFTTYNPDQFFALGMDGFSPIGWRRFRFNHSQQKAQPILVKTLTSSGTKSLSSFSYKLQNKILGSSLSPFDRLLKGQRQKESSLFTNNQKNFARRIQKRYKRVKKHPRPPVWFPSGPLSQQVLPVHYIYVFYKRYRLPRDRYVGRRFRKGNDGPSLVVQNSQNKIMDYTLRKRTKPRRKYHRKRILRKDENAFVKRQKFRGFSYEEERSRPISKRQFAQQIFEQRTTKKFKSKGAKLLSESQKNISSKQPQDNSAVRIRQLRRRIQRQIIRPAWRYKPRAGGFAWSGDYLKLESVRAPKLKTMFSSDTTSSDNKILRKTRKKKKKVIQEWQVQPKKYLLQKHNLKVLKKRLERSQNFKRIFRS
jgi:hypothetical protein